MSMLRNAKVLVEPLTDKVDAIIKEKYGKEYRATNTGIVYYDGPKVPFETNVGTWSIVSSNLIVTVFERK